MGSIEELPIRDLLVALIGPEGRRRLELDWRTGLRRAELANLEARDIHSDFIVKYLFYFVSPSFDYK
jgi:hypothetical protein